MRSRQRQVRRRLAVTAAAASVAFVIAALPNVLSSSAAWNDDEWVAGKVGVVDCDAAVGEFTTRGEGRLVSGGLLGIDLDTLAAAKGMNVTNPGAAAVPDPQSGTALPPDAFANPLNIEALKAVNVDLGGGILQLPLNNNTGVLNQYGLAASDGRSVGASGMVSDSGAVATDTGDGYPELGSLSLSSLVASLNPAVAATLAGVTDISLDVGAIAGRASLDGCKEAFGVAGAVTRDYLAAGLGTTVSSPTVGALVGAVQNTVTGLQSAVNGIASNAGVLTAIRNGVTGLLNGVLGTLTLGSIAPSVSATIDLSAVNTLLDQPFGDPNGVLAISPTDGTVSVDLFALLGQAYPGTGSNFVNGLAPNAQLLVDAVVINTLTDVLGTTLNAWLANVQSLLVEALAAAHVSAGAVIDVKLLGLSIATITASVSGSLGDLVNGTVTSLANATILGLQLPATKALVQGLVSALVSGLGGVVGSAVNGVLAPLATLGTTVTGLTTPIVTAVSGVFTALYANGVVSLTVNAQNDPRSGAAEPADWGSLDAGQFDVAALRVGILDMVGTNNVHLYLGRGSVGANTSVLSVPAGPSP